MNGLKQVYQRVKKYCQERPVAAMVALFISIYYGNKVLKNQLSEVKLSYFLRALSLNIIEEVVIHKDKVKFRAQNSNTWYSTNSELLTKERLYKLLNEKENITYSCEPSQMNKKDGDLPMLFFSVIAGLYLSQRVYKMLNDQNYQPKSTENELKEKLRFADIAGLDDAKNKLTEIISFLKEPTKYQKVGARLRKGVLLYGPPGTGKTMLAKATAGESNSSFLYTTASEFVEMYVGVGAKRIRELFSTARKKSPCIIFIDEIDGLGTKRSSYRGDGDGAGSSDQERSTTLNQLLTEMDGFSNLQNIVVIAATNREQLLDQALIRSGRFDTKIHIGMPDENDRLGVLKIHTKNKQHEIKEEVLKQIANKGQGLSGADIESIVNESAYICIKDNRQVISEDDLMKSFQKFMDDKKSFNDKKFEF